MRKDRDRTAAPLPRRFRPEYRSEKFIERRDRTRRKAMS
jgi:hypothetical protein